MNKKIGTTHAGKFKDCDKIQAMMHMYGIEDFKTLLLVAAENAMDDTADLEDKSITKRYEAFIYKLSE